MRPGRSSISCIHPATAPATRRAFTLVELLVAIGIISLLIGILISVAGKIRRQAHTTACLSNLRQIGMAITQYAADNREKVVPADLMPPDPYKPLLRLGNWATILVHGGYLTAPDASIGAGGDPTKSVFHCPDGLDLDGFANDAYNSDPQSQMQAGYWRRQEATLLPDGSTVPGVTVLTWYGINGDLVGEDFPFFRFPSDAGRIRLHNVNEIDQPAELALVYDGFFHHDSRGNLLGHARHNGGTITNYLFADGHAQSIPTSQLPKSLDPADLVAAPFPKFKLQQN